MVGLRLLLMSVISGTPAYFGVRHTAMANFRKAGLFQHQPWATNRFRTSLGLCIIIPTQRQRLSMAVVLPRLLLGQ